MSKEKETYGERSLDCQASTHTTQPTVATAHQDASSGIPVVYPRHNYNSVLASTGGVPEPVVNPSVHQRNEFRINNEKKSLVEAYLLWLVLGVLGAHHFYLRRHYFGVLYFLTCGLFGVGFIIDLFRLPYLVKQTNRRQFGVTEIYEKNLCDAYTLWFPFGVFGYALAFSPYGPLGAHHFYLNRPIWGMFHLLTLGFIGFLWLVDLFRIPFLVKRANKEIVFGPDQEKHVDDAYLLWLTFGVIGAHHFYLGRPQWGLLYFFTIGLFGIGWLVDGCRMVHLVKDSNTRSNERAQLAVNSVARDPGLPEE